MTSRRLTPLRATFRGILRYVSAARRHAVWYSVPPMTVDEQLAYLTKGCIDVVRAAELRSKLERSASARRPLVVKVGFDPTAPDLHLGHTVLIRKMKHFQDLGHTVVY